MYEWNLTITSWSWAALCWILRWKKNLSAQSAMSVESFVKSNSALQPALYHNDGNQVRFQIRHIGFARNVHWIQTKLFYSLEFSALKIFLILFEISNAELREKTSEEQKFSLVNNRWAKTNYPRISGLKYADNARISPLQFKSSTIGIN